MGRRLEGTTLPEVAVAFMDTYNNVVNGTLAPKAAQEANRSLSGIVGVKKTEFDFLVRAKAGEDMVRKQALKSLGVASGSPAIEQHDKQ
jgi:hypothetical protein